MTLFDYDARRRAYEATEDAYADLATCEHGRTAAERCPSCPHPDDLNRQAAWLRSNAGPEEAAAADTVAKATGSPYRRMVLTAHYHHPDGLTDDAVARIVDHPDMPPPRAASRRGELAKWGWLEKAVDPNGAKVTRPTRTGHQAQVWHLTVAARRLLDSGEVLL